MRKLSTNNGYRLIHLPNHPRAWKTGYIYEHIIITENKLGRLLATDEVVHHKDENKTNNHPNNLEVLTRAKHRTKHVKPVTNVALVCSSCGINFTRRKGNEPAIKGYKKSYCSRECFYKSKSIR